MKKIAQRFWFWVYTVQHCRVGTNIHVAHYWFGKRVELIGECVGGMGDIT